MPAAMMSVQQLPVRAACPLSAGCGPGAPSLRKERVWEARGCPHPHLGPSMPSLIPPLRNWIIPPVSKGR